MDAQVANNKQINIGDYWHERFIPIAFVLDIEENSRGTVVVTAAIEPAGDGGYNVYSDRVKRYTPEQFFNRVKHADLWLGRNNNTVDGKLVSDYNEAKKKGEVLVVEDNTTIDIEETKKKLLGIYKDSVSKYNTMLSGAQSSHPDLFDTIKSLVPLRFIFFIGNDVKIINDLSDATCNVINKIHRLNIHIKLRTGLDNNTVESISTYLKTNLMTS